MKKIVIHLSITLKNYNKKWSFSKYVISNSITGLVKSCRNVNKNNLRKGTFHCKILLDVNASRIRI